MDMEEGTFCRFGTPLEPLDEDEVPSKKPIAVEDQIVTDSNGKRRFHGAFTGGFSAGFWNTVGSLEGWKPQSFKSSRAEKAERMSQRPTDFMDEEDLGEFGIAPQRVQTTADFAVEAATSSSELNRKRKLQQYNDGPIPGVPVLHQLLKPSKENIATRLLKRMGWKEGQGVGARQTRKEKKTAAQRNARERYVMRRYGCDMDPAEKVDEKEIKSAADQNDDDSDLSDDEITFAPDDFEPFLCSIKNNAFGLGYAGLSRDPVLQKQHINLFGAFEVMGKDNKKLSIRGQAFGVGALEEEDDDIYERDDMTRYDFSLDDKRKAKVKDKQKQEVGVLEEFQASRNIGIYRKKIFTIIVPAGFKPRNWAVRKTRFEPLDDDRVSLLRTKENYKTRGLGRHDLDPEERGHILGETSKAARDQMHDESKNIKKKTYLERINEKYKQKDKEEESCEELNRIAKKVDDSSKGEVLHETLSLEEAAKIESKKVQADAMKLTKNLDKTSGVFKPFAMYDSKQTRYDNFLQQNLRNDDEITKFLETIQPLNMSAWDREMEKKEFIQARNIYRPLKGLMSDRFVSESAVVAERVIAETIKATNKKVEVVRTKSMWKPSAHLCKRFNVAEPFGGTMEEKKDRKKPRFSVFDYLETSINSKDNFKTPVIIPTKTEKPKTIVSQTESEQKTSASVSSNELFEKEISSSQIEWNRVTESKSVPSELIPPKRTNNKMKSPLEKKVEELQAKHPSEKRDLFKAIFDSSSEDEGTESQNEGVAKPSAQFQDTEAHNDIFATMKKSAAEINILRNTSPPRGIFASLFAKKSDEIIEKIDVEKQVGNLEASTTPPNEVNKDKLVIPKKIAFKPRNERMKESSVEVVDVYGPKTPILPTATVLMPDTPEKKLDQVDTELVKLLKKQKKAIIVEKWVEKSDSASDGKKKKKNKDRDKKKKSKKHKKDKKRHKDKK